MAQSVQIQNLCKTFSGKTRAMDNVSLNILPGELFFLLGPSGCGKTTLLRSIAGFCPPDSGTIHIGDRDVTRLPAHQRDTGMVFQSYALWPHMTIRQNVAFGLDMRKVPAGEKEKRVSEALELVQMTARADAKPNELSGGQQQRVALARALVVHPQCLLLDEPLSNLDAKLRLEMRQEIRRICKEVGRTAIYVTHDQKEALSVADKIAVINQGSIQQIGTPAEIYRRPVSSFVAGFIGETNFFDATVVDSTANGITVDTRIGRLLSTVPPAEKTAKGSLVKVSIRPETISIGEPPAHIQNRLSGEFCHTIYLGEIAQHELTVQEGVHLKVFELNPRTSDNRHSASLWINPDDVVLLST